MRIVVTLALAFVLYYSLEFLARPIYEVPQVGAAILITGARGGIGLSAGKRLAQNGRFHVFAATRTTKDADAINALNISNFAGMKLDLHVEADMIQAEKHIREWCRTNSQAFAGVVHNGIRLPDFRFAEFQSMETFDEILGTGLRSVFLLNQKLLPLLREHRGRVVGISSAAAQLAVIGNTEYAATKAGLDVLLKVLRLEVAHAGVAVTNIVVGMIKAESSADYLDNLRTGVTDPRVKQFYPEYYHDAQNIVDRKAPLMKNAWATSDRGSSDDLIYDAFTNSRPPFTVVTGAGVPGLGMSLLLKVFSWLPESFMFRAMMAQP